MFNATLDSVGIRLAQTDAAVTTAIAELTEFGSLTWQTMAGKEFRQRATDLAERLNGLRSEIAETQEQLIAAMLALAELEEQIIARQLVQ